LLGCSGSSSALEDDELIAQEPSGLSERVSGLERRIPDVLSRLADVVGALLGGLVAGLALLAAATGLCTGCEAYKLGSYLLGRPFVSCPLPPRPAMRSE
jgi:hypothetical protein